MLQERVAVRYTRALYEYAQAQGSLEAVLADQQGMLALLDDSRELRVFLASPILSDARKRSIIQQIFHGKLHKDTDQFYDYLTSRGREEMIPYIAREFVNQYNRAHNVRLAVITTATALAPEAVQALRQKLEAQTEGRVEMNLVVDPAVIGGMTVQVDDLRIDNTIAGALGRARQALKTA
jgi:F-type H+-transporting ATPase subunit delta